MNRVAVLLSLLLATPAVGHAGPRRGTEGNLGAAPSFSVRTVEGKMVRLSELRGRPVVIDFWATWCVPCRATLPQLDTLQSRYRDQGLFVLGLSVDDDGLQLVRRYAGRLGLRYPIALASENVLDLYGPIRMIPTTFFIDRRGIIARRVVGSIDGETIDGYVREVLGP